ncbi:carboxypeptidase-like regulatory domain-containing protein, partial [candidate division KSB1 bacterium]
MRIILSALASIFLILHSLSSQTFSQTVIPRTAVITGRVTDASTGEPLPGANVYIANTLMGAASGKDGVFTIRKVPFGDHQIIASFISYKPVRKKIRIDRRGTFRLNIQLEPSALRLDAVLVHGSNKEWKRNLEIFKRQFLGTTKHANKCTILNAEYLDFDHDRETGIFKASAADLLKIENRSLGYMLVIYLEYLDFRYDVTKMDYAVSFTELPLMNPKERENREENREDAYYGSLRHLLNTMALSHEDDLHYFREGFLLSEIY